MRGEDFFVISRVARFPETPPHAWGRPIEMAIPVMMERNTPTCVGKTLCIVYGGSKKRKHPHMRGEDLHPGGQLTF